MTELIAAVSAVVGYLAVRWLLQRFTTRYRRHREPERTVECTCGVELPVSKAHIVSAVFEGEEERAMGGATAVVAEYCADHCPVTLTRVTTADGTHVEVTPMCNHPEEHR